MRPVSYGRFWGGGALIWTADSAGRRDINQDGNFNNDTIQTSGTCTSCHYGFWSQKDVDPGPGETLVALRHKTWNHHLSDKAQAGNCVSCHDTVRTTAAGSSWCVVQGSRVPKQPPCAYCHVDPTVAYGGNGDWVLQFFDFATDGFNTPLTKLTSSTHTIPNIDGVPGNPDVDPLVMNASAAVRIHDFAICFECHDESTDYGAQNSDGDMMVGLVDGDGNPMFNPTSHADNVPKKVYPYHASGMALDIGPSTMAANQETDPGPGNWFPVDRATGYTGSSEAAADDAANGGTNVGDGTDPVFDNTGSWGPGVSDDLFFAYHHHPGRGGIIGTSDVIGGVANQAGSFNILFPIMTVWTGASPKYYQSGSAEGGTRIKKPYMDAGDNWDPNYTSENFGTGGSGAIGIPNSSYTDTYGNVWDFSLQKNVPYSDYKTSPNPANDLYWTRIPYFADKYNPTMTDVVRLLTVDCAAQTVTARTALTGDYNLHRTDVQPADYVNWTGDVRITSPEAVSMTWDGDKWTGSLSAACVTNDTVTVTSYIGAGGYPNANGSASFTVP